VLSILDRYLLREIFLSSGAIFSIVLLIIVGQLFVRLLNKTVEGNLPLDVLLPLLGLVVIKAVIQLMPVALLLGVMLALGRFYKDSEIAAMRACGMGYAQLYRPLIAMAVPLSILLAALALYVLPHTVKLADQIEYEAKNKADISGVSAGQFIEPSLSGWVFFAQHTDSREGTLSSVFVNGVLNGHMMIQTAAHAKHYIDPVSGKQMLELVDGYRYQIGMPKGESQVVSFDKHTVQIPDLVISGSVDSRDTRPTAELWVSEKAADKAELQRRISVSISAFLMVLLALPLSYTSPRRGRYGKLVVGIVVYIVYANLINLSVSLMESDTLPTWIGVWWVHLMMLVFLSSLVAWQNGLQWTMSWLRLEKH
jgi:lipopolysaccharide export system permease protein